MAHDTWVVDRNEVEEYFPDQCLVSELLVRVSGCAVPNLK